MFALDRSSRTLCITLGLTCLAAAIATTPRSAGGATPFTPLALATNRESVPPMMHQLRVQRDPFAGIPHVDVAEPQTRALTRPHIVMSANSEPARIAHESTEYVSAVIAGAHPYALITDGSATRILARGEPYAGSRIIGIDLDGLRLADGRRIPVTVSVGDSHE